MLANTTHAIDDEDKFEILKEKATNSNHELKIENVPHNYHSNDNARSGDIGERSDESS